MHHESLGIPMPGIFLAPGGIAPLSPTRSAPLAWLVDRTAIHPPVISPPEARRAEPAHTPRSLRFERAVRRRGVAMRSPNRV